MPISTNTTIATCIQIQVGDTLRTQGNLVDRVRLPGSWITSATRAEYPRSLTIATKLNHRYRVHMGGRLHRFVIGCFIGLCASALLASTTHAGRLAWAHSASAAPVGGINIPATESPEKASREIAIARALHAKVVRIDLPWSMLEPLAPNQIDPAALASLDHLMDDASAAGIRMIASVDRSPCWASSAPSALLRECTPAADRTMPVPGRPATPADYGDFVAYLARRYGTHLAAIEVWNEPDQINQQYFAGPEKPQRYAAILRAAYTAIKRANPNIPVLGGSLVGSNGVFLRALYAAGIKGYYDGLAIHFYNLTLASTRSLREVQLANGDTKPLWLDEFGWSSCYPKHRVQEEQACVTAAVQARNITDIYHALAPHRLRGSPVLFDLQDSGADQFGVLSAQACPSLPYGALAKVLASPVGPQDPVTLSLSRRGGRVVASGSGPVGDYMELEAFRGGQSPLQGTVHARPLRPLLDRATQCLGTRGLRVRVYQYWTGAGRNAQRSI